MTTPANTPDPVRAAFERWFKDSGISLIKDGHGAYLYAGAARAWMTWQAAYAQARADLIASIQSILADEDLMPGQQLRAIRALIIPKE